MSDLRMASSTTSCWNLLRLSYPNRSFILLSKTDWIVLAAMLAKCSLCGFQRLALIGRLQTLSTTNIDVWLAIGRLLFMEQGTRHVRVSVGATRLWLGRMQFYWKTCNKGPHGIPTNVSSAWLSEELMPWLRRPWSSSSYVKRVFLKTHQLNQCQILWKGNCSP